MEATWCVSIVAQLSIHLTKIHVPSWGPWFKCFSEPSTCLTTSCHVTEKHTFLWLESKSYDLSSYLCSVCYLWPASWGQVHPDKSLVRKQVGSLCRLSFAVLRFLQVWGFVQDQPIHESGCEGIPFGNRLAGTVAILVQRRSALILNLKQGLVSVFSAHIVY